VLLKRLKKAQRGLMEYMFGAERALESRLIEVGLGHQYQPLYRH
jgi:hypothetical protein